jgi:hypothetical protein
MSGSQKLGDFRKQPMAHIKTPGKLRDRQRILHLAHQTPVNWQNASQSFGRCDVSYCLSRKISSYGKSTNYQPLKMLIISETKHLFLPIFSPAARAIASL